MMKTVVIPLSKTDFDPTECAIPWAILSSAGIKAVFATSDGEVAACDPRMLTGSGLGIFANLLRADACARSAYAQMIDSDEFRSPITWNDIETSKFHGLLLPGGHAPGMKEYLDSERLKVITAQFFEMEKPVAAICHGVLLAARSKLHGESVLVLRKTTCLLKRQELFAWFLTRWNLGNYYRTYSQTVEDEIRSVLASSEQFLSGPLPLWRDSSSHLHRGFTVQDGNFLSARWPGDAHRFAADFVRMLR